MRLLLFNLATDMDDPILGFTTRWIQALAERVEYIHVITMRTGRVEIPGNVRVYSVGKEIGYSEPERAVEFYRHLLRVLRHDRIDACFSHMIPIFTVLAAPVLKARKIPIVTWYAHPSLTWTLKLAHHLSHRMVASMPTAYPYHRDKLVVVGHGIDTDLFSPDGQTAPEHPPMILCVGRVSPVKDHATLIKALSVLRQEWGKPFRAVVLGAPTGPQAEPYVRSLHKQVKELGLEVTISFEPPLSQDMLPIWYRRCTVHVNLTPTGFGDKTAWEAMACGRPCVAANEGFRETFGCYGQELLFQYRNPDSLAERLAWVLALEEQQQNAIGTYLRAQVAKLHSLERLGDNLANLLESLNASCRRL